GNGGGAIRAGQSTERIVVSRNVYVVLSVRGCASFALPKSSTPRDRAFEMLSVLYRLASTSDRPTVTMRSSYRLKNAVADATYFPAPSVCSTPPSTLALRSGLRFGLSVNAISNASGGRIPVPALARTRSGWSEPAPFKR